MLDSQKLKMWKRISRGEVSLNSMPACKIFKDRKKETSRLECRNFNVHRYED